MSVHTSATSDLDVLEASAQKLEPGKPVTIEPGLYHKYVVSGTGDEITTLRAILTPGDSKYETALKILNGMDEDGILEQELLKNQELAVILTELTDAHILGPAMDMVDRVRAEKGEEIEALRAKLFEKYDTEEALKALLISS